MKISTCFLLITLLLFNKITSAQSNIHYDTDEIGKVMNESSPVFLQNSGRWDESVLFRTSASGAEVSFMKNKISFAIDRRIEKNIPPQIPLMNLNGEPKPDPIQILVWNLDFENCNPSPIVTPVGSHSSHKNYFWGNDPAKWKTDVPCYEKIIYKNIYDNIDLCYYNKNSSLEYDYTIHPNADLSAIRMKLDGVKNIRVDQAGDLEIETAFGTVKEKKPIAYQIINNETKPVQVSFRIFGNDVYGFSIESAYDESSILIIDPVMLEWSTFVGGAADGNGYVFDLAVDSAGYVYATGYYNDNFPVTSGVYDTTYNQGGSCGFGGAFEDVFVIKLNPDATSIVWATYIGGSCAERGRGIAINPQGDCFVTGWTRSVDFPKVNSILSSLNGSTDAFVLRLNSNGSVLSYSSDFGGEYNDWAEKITIDKEDEAVATGATLNLLGDPGFQVTANAFQYNYGGGSYQSDAYIIKFTASGNLIWASYLGGALWDWGYSIGLDSSANIYITGRGQTGFPTTPGAFQTANNGADDVFVTCIDSSGAAIIYSTLVGGSTTTNGSCACESGNSIYVNKQGETYITGNVRSSDFPTTAGAYDVTYNDGYYGDNFAFELNATGSDLIFSTYLGGTTLDIGWGIDVNDSGEVFLAGYSDATDFPTTTCAFDSTYNGTSDADFTISKLSKDGSTLLYSTYIGGNDQDYWEPKVRVMGDECDQRIVFSGTSHSQNFPTTAGTIQPVKLNGVNDQPVIFKMKPKIFPGFISPDSVACNDAVSFIDTTKACGLWNPSFITEQWDFGDGTFANGNTVTHIYSTAGTYTVKLSVGCPMDSVSKIIVVSCGNISSVQIACTDTSLCEKFCISFTDLSINNPVAWQWVFEGGSPPASTDQNPTMICYNDSGTFDVTLITTDGGGNMDTLVLHNFITVFSNPAAPVITQSGDTLFSTSAASYQWYLGAYAIPGATNQDYIITQSGLYTVEVGNQSGCTAQVSVTAYLSGIENPDADNTIHIYSNPAGENLFIQYHGRNVINAECSIINILGVKLWQHTEANVSDEQSISVDVRNFAEGTYFFIFTSREKTMVVKWVKQ